MKKVLKTFISLKSGLSLVNSFYGLIFGLNFRRKSRVFVCVLTFNQSFSVLIYFCLLFHLNCNQIKSYGKK